MPPQLRKVEELDREQVAAPARWDFRGELRALLRLAIPVVLSELAWMLMSVVDTIMVGRLSPEAIGAVGLSSSLYYIPALFGAGLLLGLDTLVSQAYGRGDHADCRKWVMQGIYIVLLFSVPVMIIVAVDSGALAALGNQSRRRLADRRLPAPAQLGNALAADLRLLPPLSPGHAHREAGHLRPGHRQRSQPGRELAAHLREVRPARDGRSRFGALDRLRPRLYGGHF